MDVEKTEQHTDQKEGGMNDTAHKTSSGDTGRKPGSVGPIVGIVIIVAVLILGGLYYWGVKLNEEDRSEITAEEIESMPDETLENLESQSTSDTVDAIEEDLQSTELEGLDSDLDQVDEELNSL